jgi:hypothetical protein
MVLHANYGVVDVGKSLKVFFAEEIALSEGLEGHQLIGEVFLTLGELTLDNDVNPFLNLRTVLTPKNHLSLHNVSFEFETVDEFVFLLNVEVVEFLLAHEDFLVKEKVLVCDGLNV